jgi:hypothetical protein
VDPAQHDAIARALAYVHPGWMLVSLALAGLSLRRGLQMRRLRQRGKPPGKALWRSHVKIAKPAVVLLGVGLLGGPLSAWLLRDWQPFATFHAFAGLLTGGLFAATGYLGWQLSRGRSRAVEAHGRLGLVAFLIAGLASVAGFVLLP